jgi:thiol-disulfide isomerase/thioredoxin
MAASDARDPRPSEAADGVRDESRSRLAGARRWAIEIAVVVGLYLALTAYQERHLLPSHSAAPQFELSTLDGRRVSLESLRGKRVALQFWATWCGVCRREEGTLNAVTKSLDGDEALYAVVADSDDVEMVREFVAREHIDYPVLLGNSDVLAAYHVESFPTTYYVDAEGRIGGRTVGMATRYSMRARFGLLRR